MKKRILSFILAVVMLSVSLVGCGNYDFAEDDMSKYATFDKNAFDVAFSDGSLTINDGTFTTDPTVREQKVMDSIFASIGSKADKTDKKTEGTPDGHDLFYYAYYITATVDGKDYVFTVDTMVKDKAEETQFGTNFPSDLEGEIIKLFADYEFTADTSYAPITSGNAVKDQLVFVSYERSYTLDDAAGTTQKVVATKHPMILKDGDLFAEKLVGQVIGSKIDSINVEVADKTSDDYKNYAGEYKNVKIEWAVNEKAAPKTFTEVTYDTEKKISPTLKINDKSTVDLKNAELTYNVYPVYYVDVEDFTATAVINSIYANNVTYANIRTILIGPDFAEMTEDEQNKALDKYKFTVDGEEVTLEEFVTTLDTAQQAVVDKKKALTTAEEAYESKKTAYESAEKAVETAQKNLDEAEEGADKTKLQEALDKAKTSLETAKAAYETAKKTYEGEDGKSGAKKDYEDKVAERDAKVKIFFDKVTEEAVVNGYKENIVYEGLLNTYNTGIKESLAKEIFALMKKNVTVKSLPEKAVEEAEEYLMQNYEYCFYKNVKLGESSSSSNSSSTEETFYKKHGGSFQEFLVKYAVPTDLDVTVENYDEALAAIKTAAEESVKEMVIVYTVAKAYNLTATDEVYEEYIESEDYDYTKEAYNGEDAARFAFQFDKVMNYILDNEESDDGKFVNYKRVKFKVVDADEKSEEESEDDHDHDHDH